MVAILVCVRQVRRSPKTGYRSALLTDGSARFSAADVPAELPANSSERVCASSRGVGLIWDCGRLASRHLLPIGNALFWCQPQT
jgi:hypothetical protein